MTTKDIATLLLSGTALATSITMAIFTWLVQRQKSTEEQRKAFEEALLGISTAKHDFEALRREAGDAFEASDMIPRRIAIVETRNFYLSKAIRALEFARFKPTSTENLLIAAALIESGRIAASIPFYRQSLDTAADDYERAVALRVLGRANILAGNANAGRETMLSAANLFAKLATDPSFEPTRMRRDEAETYRRLIEAQLMRQVRPFAIDTDVAALRAMMGRLDEATRTRLELFLAKVADHLRAFEPAALPDISGGLLPAESAAPDDG